MRRFGILALGLAAGCGNGPSSPIGPFAEARLASAETPNGATPMFLVTPGGARVLSWVTAPEGGSAGRLAISVTPAGGGGARPAVFITDSLGPIQPHGEAPPQLAADTSGALYALYVVGKEVIGERFPRSALRLARSTDEGRTWGEPVTVNEGEAFGSHSFHSLLASPDGAVYVSWLGSSGLPGDPPSGASRIWLRASRDGGRTWGATHGLDTDEACPCCRSALAIGPDGSLYVAWRKVFPGDVRDVVVARSTNGGETWSAPVRPREDGWVYPGCPHAGPSLRVDESGVVHIAWWTGKSGEAGVYYARSADLGLSFQAQPIAVGRTSRPAHVQVGLTRTGPVVVWDDGLSEQPRVLLRASADSGARFGPVVQVSPRSESGSLPVVAVQRDSIRIAWTAAASAGGAAHADHPADPKASMPLPKVGDQRIVERVAPLVAGGTPPG